MEKSDCTTRERLRLQYLFTDPPPAPGLALSDYDTLEFLSHGCHLRGQILWPDGGFCEPRPCAILLHGYPGSARNDDLAHALCRIGCVVLTPHHRGAWGSEGEYLISHCIEDAVALAEYVRSEPFAGKYHVDPDAVYLIGHSMGGNTALHTAKKLPWLRGVVLMTPFDPTRYIREGRPELMRELLEQGAHMNSGGTDAIYQDILEHLDALAFETAAHALKDRNLLCVTGTADVCAPAEKMLLPLWELLQAHTTAAVRMHIALSAEHGLLGCRIALAEAVAEFIAETLS